MEVKQESVDALMNFLLSTAKDIKDFTMDQAPGFAKEIVRYGMVSSYTYTIIGLTFMILAAKLISKAIKTNARESLSAEAKQVVYGLSGGLFIFVGVIMFFCNLNTAIKTTIAPKVYLINQLTGKNL